MLKAKLAAVLAIALAVPAFAQTTTADASKSQNPQAASNPGTDKSTSMANGNGSPAQVQSTLNSIRSTAPGNVGSGVTDKPSATTTTVAPQ